MDIEVLDASRVSLGGLLMSSQHSFGLDSCIED